MKYFKVQFADDTNLSNFRTSIKIINKQINHDLRNLLNWFNTNRIPPKVRGTELLMFSLPQKQLNNELEINTL